MPFLTVKLKDKDRLIAFESGRFVRNILDETDLRVRAGCNGTGSCGLCRIKILAGAVKEPSTNERTCLGAGLLSSGVRLACQVQANNDLQVEILNPAPSSSWRSLYESKGTISFHKYTSQSPDQNQNNPIGVCIDIGTTHISITLWDMSTRQRLAGRFGLNPQASCGADVLSRLIAAKSPDQAERLSSQVISAIGDGLRDISVREGIDIRRTARVVLVGNSAMLALLSGQNFLCLLDPKYWTSPIDCLPLETASWSTSWGINREASIKVIPPLAGFVGSDLLAGVAATHLIEKDRKALLIDFGTNSEIALWDGNHLWVTSAAGGPAFEGCGISCGMPAEPGAIYRVTYDEISGDLKYDIIAGTEPQGLCGSGMVDLLACLIRNKTLNNKGQFTAPVPDGGFPFYRGNDAMVLTKNDIDIFQRAKAAIGVGLQVLLTKSGLKYNELSNIFLGGVFGQHVDIANAQEIGLLPVIPEQLIETAGNTALSGCEIFLIEPDTEEYLEKVRKRFRIINLSDWPDFGTLFLENLYLRPIVQE